MSNKPGFLDSWKHSKLLDKIPYRTIFSKFWGNPINAIKNVLNSDSVSPVSTSDNDPAPAPAPAPSPRRYRP